MEALYTCRALFAPTQRRAIYPPVWNCCIDLAGEDTGLLFIAAIQRRLGAGRHTHYILRAGLSFFQNEKAYWSYQVQFNMDSSQWRFVDPRSNGGARPLKSRCQLDLRQRQTASINEKTPGIILITIIKLSRIPVTAVGVFG